MYVSSTNLCSAIFQIPELDMPVTDGYKVTTILCECYRLHFGTNFITGYFNVILPVPYIHYHVML